MSAPSGWDEQSWGDVLAMQEAVRTELARLSDLVGHESPDPAAIDASFRNIRTFSDVGSAASSWAKA